MLTKPLIYALTTLTLAASASASQKTIHRVAPLANASTQAPAEKGMIGVMLSTDKAGRPVVQSTIEGGPAAKAGLESGDKIVAVNGKGVKTTEALSEALSGLSVGKTVKLSISRDGWRKQIKLKLASRDSLDFSVGQAQGSCEETAQQLHTNLAQTLSSLGYVSVDEDCGSASECDDEARAECHQAPSPQVQAECDRALSSSLDSQAKELCVVVEECGGEMLEDCGSAMECEVIIECDDSSPGSGAELLGVDIRALSVGGGCCDEAEPECALGSGAEIDIEIQELLEGLDVEQFIEEARAKAQGRGGQVNYAFATKSGQGQRSWSWGPSDGQCSEGDLEAGACDEGADDDCCEDGGEDDCCESDSGGEWLHCEEQAFEPCGPAPRRFGRAFRGSPHGAQHGEMRLFRMGHPGESRDHHPRGHGHESFFEEAPRGFHHGGSFGGGHHPDMRRAHGGELAELREELAELRQDIRKLRKEIKKALRLANRDR